jgi:gag-polyprotein putative aspartyl protease
MSSFTHTLQSLEQQGPLVEVYFLPSDVYLDQNPLSPVPMLKVMAMIDTGATTTVLKEGFAAQLGIKPVGATTITTPSSTDLPCLQYDMAIAFGNNVKIGSIVVTEAPLQGQHIQCLIGRDILANAMLVYIGYTNTFTLAF